MENPTDNRRKLSVDPKCFKLGNYVLNSLENGKD